MRCQRHACCCPLLLLLLLLPPAAAAAPMLGGVGKMSIFPLSVVVAVAGCWLLAAWSCLLLLLLSSFDELANALKRLIDGP